MLRFCFGVLTLITLSDRTKLPIEAVIIEISMATGWACVEMYYMYKVVAVALLWLALSFME